MATHTNILVWRILWTEESGKLWVHRGPKESDMTEAIQHTFIIMSQVQKRKLGLPLIFVLFGPLEEWMITTQISLPTPPVGCQRSNWRTWDNTSCRMTIFLSHHFSTHHFSIPKLHLPLGGAFTLKGKQMDWFLRILWQLQSLRSLDINGQIYQDPTLQGGWWMGSKPMLPGKGAGKF